MIYVEIKGVPRLEQSGIQPQLPAIRLFVNPADSSDVAAMKRFIIEQNRVKEWDGVEPLRRNHRVKQGVVEAVDGNMVCIREPEEGLAIWDTSLGGVQPLKPSLEYLHNKWKSLPKPAPYVGMVSYEKEFVQWLIDNGHVTLA